MSVPTRLLVLFCVCGLCAGGFSQTALPLITRPVDDSQVVVLKGNTHPLATPAFDQGPAPIDLPMNRMLLVLKRSPEQESALRTLLDNQQDKASPSYHKWLTPDEFGRQFGPSDQDIQQITLWLQSHGFQVGQVSKGRAVIEFSGTASQVRKAFHTSMHKYLVNGEEHWANANDPAIPAALTPAVAGVWTLHNFLKKPQLHVSAQRIAARVSAGAGAKPQVTFPGNPPFHALGPADFATIYNIGPLSNQNNGAGNRIAVVGRSDTFQSNQDITNFDDVFGIQYLVNTIVNGPDPGDLGGDEEVEATLDLTWSHAIAPAAMDFLVVSESTTTTDGIDLSELYIIDNDFADVMTESFGTCEADATSAEAAATSSLAEQAAAQGITYIVSAGDTGAEGCDPNGAAIAKGPVSASLLATTPFNVAAGGTMFNDSADESKYWSSTNSTDFVSALSYIPEDVWNESCTAASCGQDANIAAGGGGASIFFSKPSWQTGALGIPSDHARDVPDISLDSAGNVPYLLCLEGSCIPDSQGNFQFTAVYGTSAAAPSFAGIMTLVDYETNSRQGQANYVLYRLAAAENSTLSTCNASNTSTLPVSTCVFNDVTVGNNAVPGEIGYGTPSAQYESSVGYDLATGLGSVNVANLVNAWKSASFNASTTTLSISTPFPITHGQAVSVSVNVTGNSGVPSGTVSLIGGLTSPVGIDSHVLAGGTAAWNTALLPGGSYNLKAYYSGDSTFGASNSNTIPVNVHPENSSTQVQLPTFTPNGQQTSPNASTASYGSPYILRINVLNSAGSACAQFACPTGSVTLTDNNSPLDAGTYNLNSLGYFEDQTIQLPAGSHSIKAQYSGDSSFNPSTSATDAVTITQAATSTAVTTSGASSGVTLNATVSSNSSGNPPTGTVQFSINGNPSGAPVAVSGVAATFNQQTGAFVGAQATATYNDPQLANGNYTVQAVYSGDTNYTASSSPPSLTSVQPNFSMSSSASVVNVSAPGGTGSLTLTIAAVDGFNGAVNFSCTGLPSQTTCSAPSVTGSGSSVLTLTTTAVGSAAVVAPQNPPPGSKLDLWSATFGFSFAAMFLLSAPGKRRHRNILLATILLASASLIGCGGGGNNTPPPVTNPGTPVGASMVTVTATSGSLTHTTTFTLNVQ